MDEHPADAKLRSKRLHWLAARKASVQSNACLRERR
eukprot:CAMPEP_0177572478 /NCGR_PEP_ID=MMETSP0369-20130122/77980_1 /TAXON_ID=447022 ORGANISM="Scrippsiella hangoei-like, Strain SHHI-4" /NCGR_SAMPLE_ID=MMETSP0369 /ASSEMBLY_ACC=CAM_ASM_000364 /LENGTH=35 /DNA_ID= /DNA_START= /DNA_END= /DNA_ORIENTATION=